MTPNSSTVGGEFATSDSDLNENIVHEGESEMENDENEVQEDPAGQWVVKHSHINLNLRDDIILRYPETIQERTKRTKGYKRVVLLLCM
jgi:hypothetical protein